MKEKKEPQAGKETKAGNAKIKKSTKRFSAAHKEGNARKNRQQSANQAGTRRD